MGHTRINGRNISHHWLNRHRAEIEGASVTLKLCVLLLLWDLVTVQEALNQLVREGSVRETPDGRYEAI